MITGEGGDLGEDLFGQATPDAPAQRGMHTGSRLGDIARRKEPARRADHVQQVRLLDHRRGYVTH